jgi:parallel beta-helix repeat protein
MPTLGFRTRSVYVVSGLVAVAILIGAGLLAGAGQAPSGPSPRPGPELAYPGPDAVGPQPTIACPADAVVVPPGASIQEAVDAHPRYTTFCLKAGTHTIASAITPHTGDTFVGEYGAILDGTGWTTTDPDQGAFRAHNEDIDRVTIRNLVIRHMPQKGIHASYSESSDWTIEYNELTANQVGVGAPNHSFVSRNYIHHNTSGGYSAYRATGTTFESNEIANNGSEQKIVQSQRVTFRDNFVHDNQADGIWYDSDNVDAVIEGNQVARNGREGISYEVSGRGVIRNNTIRGSAGTGIFISTSKDVEISGNTLVDNHRGVQYFLNCEAVGGGSFGFDLANDTSHDNVVTVSTADGAYANGLSYLSRCPAASVAPYLDGSKRLTFARTKYVVPSPSGRYWFWGLNGISSLTDLLHRGPGTLKSWSEWQALGQDTTGVVVKY